MDFQETRPELDAFVLPPEVWSLVGEKLQLKTETLYSLVKTCRNFRVIFTPYLYTRRQIILNYQRNDDALQKRRDSLLSSLTYTRELELELQAPSSFKRGMKSGHGEKLHLKLVSSILGNIPKLLSLQWKDSREVKPHEQNPAPVLRIPEPLSIIENNSTLKRLALYFPDPHRFSRVTTNPGVFVPLRGIKNLTFLELFNFDGSCENTGPMIDGIVNILYDCPNLKTFGIGMHNQCDSDSLGNFQIAHHELIFFQELCVQYGSRRHSKPLALETLRLGFGMFVEHTLQDGDNFLIKLFDPSSLINLHIFNGTYSFEADYDDDGEGPDAVVIEPDWTLFEDCSSLRQISVTVFDEGAMTFCNFAARSASEIIATHHVMMQYEHFLQSFSELATPLTTLVTWDEYSEERFGRQPVTETNLPHWYADVPIDQRTVLDRLPDHGEELERICVCLEFETQWERFRGHLSRMNNLKEIRLNAKNNLYGQYPKRQLHFWPDLTASQDIALRYAQLLKWICPSLQSIMIGQYAWDVDTDYRKVSQANIYTAIKPQPLEKGEILGIFIFSIKRFHSQIGIPTFGLDRSYTDEYENDIWQQHEDMILSMLGPEGLARRLEELDANPY